MRTFEGYWLGAFLFISNLKKHSSLIPARRPVPKCKRGAVGPFISAGEWSYRPTCKYRARVMWVPAIGAQSIKFGLKGQVTYVETAEKGAIGKIAIGRLRNKSSRR